MHRQKRRVVAVLTSAAMASGASVGVAAACGDRSGDSGNYPTDTSGSYPSDTTTTTTTTTAGSTATAAGTVKSAKRKAKRKVHRAAS